MTTDRKEKVMTETYITTYHDGEGGEYPALQVPWSDVERLLAEHYDQQGMSEHAAFWRQMQRRHEGSADSRAVAD